MDHERETEASKDDKGVGREGSGNDVQGLCFGSRHSAGSLSATGINSAGARRANAVQSSSASCSIDEHKVLTSKRIRSGWNILLVD